MSIRVDSFQGIQIFSANVPTRVIRFRPATDDYHFAGAHIQPTFIVQALRTPPYYPTVLDMTGALVRGCGQIVECKHYLVAFSGFVFINLVKVFAALENMGKKPTNNEADDERDDCCCHNWRYDQVDIA